MSQVVESVDVAVPVRTAYNQWTQFEEFPAFMHSVREIRQLDDTRLHWVVEFGGVRREFDARITEQHPDERVAWTSTEGPRHAGVVTFHRLDDTHSRVTAQLDIDPEGFVENVADKVGIVDRVIRSDMANFREFIEHRGAETGAWRGDVASPSTAPAAPKPGSWLHGDAVQAAPDLTQSTDVTRMPDADDSRHAI
ncbi:SRPBCC family protein [Dactylosporangium maewongense]|uniref:SRPBCC family protein n=1 Tax=Dactylosporangium maewongense TaxID=634393 RepID=A0ABP4LBN2_9ACTN